MDDPNFRVLSSVLVQLKGPQRMTSSVGKWMISPAPPAEAPRDLSEAPHSRPL